MAAVVVAAVDLVDLVDLDLAVMYRLRPDWCYLSFALLSTSVAG